MAEKTHVKVFDIGGRFPVWKYGMEILFKVKKLKGVVDGTETCPRLSTGATQKDIDDWVEKDEQAQMLLYEALSMRALETLTQQKTSAAMWKKLCAVHQQKTEEKYSSYRPNSSTIR
jgi:hypothetical protein